MFCGSCGREIENNADFCTACGKRLKVSPNDAVRAAAIRIRNNATCGAVASFIIVLISFALFVMAENESTWALDYSLVYIGAGMQIAAGGVAAVLMVISVVLINNCEQREESPLSAFRKVAITHLVLSAVSLFWACFALIYTIPAFFGVDGVMLAAICALFAASIGLVVACSVGIHWARHNVGLINNASRMENK